MSDQNDQQPGGVRRVGPKDRKSKLESGGLQYPPPDSPEAASSRRRPADAGRFPPLPPEPKPSQDRYPPLSPEDRFPPLDEPPLPFDEDDFVPPVMTPPEERFPTTEPDAPTETPLFEPDVTLPEPAPMQMPPPRKHKRRAGDARRKRGADWHNAVAILFLLASVAVLAAGVTIFRDPYSALNPFPPALPPPIYITATFAPAASATPGPTASFTPLPVEMLTAMAPSNPGAGGQTAVPAPTLLPTVAPSEEAIAPTVDILNATAIGGG